MRDGREREKEREGRRRGEEEGGARIILFVPLKGRGWGENSIVIFLLVPLSNSKDIKSVTSGGFKGQLPDRIRRVVSVMHA